MTTESSLPHRRASCGRWRLKWMNRYGIYGFQVIVLGKGMKEGQYNGHALSMAYEHRTSRPSFLNLSSDFDVCKWEPVV
ncbi:hypothetical protein EVAR_100913_1 [Eumeta japonica]|uniref:Uncharacterized protein n=1 Tax=Eumeta variegata TaxID=151549 RepID=A0A4C2A7X7_EUMVA|nr:hypothetical protein EVAR_100913_1 [Eumeta japonica]